MKIKNKQNGFFVIEVIMCILLSLTIWYVISTIYEDLKNSSICHGHTELTGQKTKYSTVNGCLVETEKGWEILENPVNRYTNPPKK